MASRNLFLIREIRGSTSVFRLRFDRERGGFNTEVRRFNAACESSRTTGVSAESVSNPDTATDHAPGQAAATGADGHAPPGAGLFTKGPPDVLDHATSEIASGSKRGIDATKKIPGEGFKRSWPPVIKMDAGVRKRIDLLFG